MSQGSSPTISSDDDEISLLDVFIVLAKYKKLVLGLPFIAAIAAAAYSLSLPNIYTGSTKILPPQQSQSTAAAMLGQLGALAGVAGAALGIKNPNDLYVGMLKSRTVADNLIGRFDLKNLYKTKTAEDARTVLEGSTKITSGKDGLITIEFDDREPKRAAAIANAYVEELYKLTQTLAVTEASQRRLFFERQFAQTKENLGRAEMAARTALEKGGLANVDAQSRGILETTARLRAQISAKEIEISAMRTFAADRNPDLVLGQEALGAMKRELANIEGAKEVTGKEQRSPGAPGLENVRLLREVKYNEVLYELLARQYEVAKIDEAKDTALIQVLDKALEPEGKSKPKRTLLVMLTAFAVGFIAILLAFASEANERARQNPQQAERIKLLRRYIWGK